MASTCKEVLVDVSPDRVWDAIRDVGALHTRLVPGFVTHTELEEEGRVVTFAGGLVLRERIVDLDDGARRLVWSVTGAPFSHHNASLQVFERDGGSRVVWTADMLPHELRETVAGIMDRGMTLMKQTLEASR